MEPIYPSGMETQLDQNFQKEIPLHLIKSLLHIHLQEHKTTLTFLILEGME